MLTCVSIFYTQGWSVKFAWNRLPTSLAAGALNKVLPYYHSVKKREVYRIRAAVSNNIYMCERESVFGIVSLYSFEHWLRFVSV